MKLGLFIYKMFFSIMNIMLVYEFLLSFVFRFNVLKLVNMFNCLFGKQPQLLVCN
jgi:hypothetical protein